MYPHRPSGVLDLVNNVLLFLYVSLLMRLLFTTIRPIQQCSLSMLYSINTLCNPYSITSPPRAGRHSFAVTSTNSKRSPAGLTLAKMSEQAAGGGQQKKFTVGVLALPIHTLWHSPAETANANLWRQHQSSSSRRSKYIAVPPIPPPPPHPCNSLHIWPISFWFPTATAPTS